MIGLQGQIKITDFGLARYHGSQDRKLTKGVVTRWYRAPELLFGAEYYGEGVDIWSLGCILAELYLRTPLFQGQTDIDQLSKIFGIRGTPTPDNWPDVESLPYYFRFEAREPINLKSIIPNAPNSVLELLDGMLQLNPKNRYTWEDILNHEYFKKSGLGEGSEPEVDLKSLDFVRHIQKYKHSEVHA